MSGNHRHSLARVLLASTAVGAALVGAVFVSSAAFASDLGGEPAGVEAAAPSAVLTTFAPAATGDLAAVAENRAAFTAVTLARGAAPEPPPRVYCPAPGSHFVDSWGFARSGGRGHKGVDMMAPYGTPVLAPVSGTVRASNSSLGGLGFYLDDAEGNVYFGSHLASLDAVGWVEAGTQIGTVGSSGNAGTPHLHFEIAPGGGASVNPYPYALAWCLQDPADPWAEVPLP